MNFSTVLICIVIVYGTWLAFRKPKKYRTKLSVMRVLWNKDNPTHFWLCTHASNTKTKEDPFKFCIGCSGGNHGKKGRWLTLPKLIDEIPPEFLPILFDGMVDDAKMDPLEVFLDLQRGGVPERVQALFCNRELQKSPDNWKIIIGDNKPVDSTPPPNPQIVFEPKTPVAA